MKGASFLRPLFLCAVCALFSFFWSGSAGAQEEGTLQGTVTDIAGKPVEGAVLYLYYDTHMRRRPDFISPATARDGRCKVAVPSGKYWVVARLKKTEGYGPLTPGDGHSGEPAEVEIVSGKATKMAFIVADLKETMQLKAKAREGAFKISGRIVDEHASPLKGAYAVASKTEKIIGIPEYLSAWVDAAGHYTLYLPRGRYFLGGALTFPPGHDVFMQGAINVDGDLSDIDIIRKSRVAR